MIKLIAFDFDGIFTDGYVYTDSEGREMVRCSRKDTLRFPELRAMGIDLVVISKETNEVVRSRCKKMKVEYYFGVDDKLAILKRVMEERNLARDEVCYVGDDINDVECLKYAGKAVTVNDGDPECKLVADLVLKRNGGEHAVRELCDYILLRGDIYNNTYGY